ncbi:MAG: xylulokinase [Micrococcales bacterium]
MLVAGVDSSTQSCKVVVVDPFTGNEVRSGRASHPNGTHVNPRYWWAALQEAIDAAGGLAGVSAISIGGQQHGLVALDEFGNVVRDALLWNDTRSAPQAQELIEHFGADWLAAQTGSVPVASFTSTKLLWVKQHEPELAAKIAAVCLPHDWLSWRLAGYGPEGDSPLGPDLSQLTTDASDASGTGYYNSHTGEYIDQILDYVIGHRVILPKVLQINESVHSVVGMPGCKIGAGFGDNAGAAYGLALQPGDAVVSLGTSGTVFAVTPTATADASGTIAGFAAGDGEYLPLVCTLNAARVLDWAAGLLGVDHARLSDLALQAEPGAGGLRLTPYFEGERTPNLPDATATLQGMTLANGTPANLARAAIEGMLGGLNYGLHQLTAAGVQIKRIQLVGGAAANRAVQVIAGQVFGVPVVVPEPGEYVARGAARQAAGLLDPA